MSTTNTYNTEFTAKCPELTKGSWPVWWYHTTLHLQKEGVLGLVKGNCDEPTTWGKEYYEYLHLAECACFILNMCLSPLAEDKVKDIDYNDPKHVYNDLKQEFEPDTAANCLDKLNKFLNALQGNEESTVCYGGHVRGLLREWSELWPASYSHLKLKEELWMHVVLHGLGPSFQHIRNGYAGAEKQDAATLLPSTSQELHPLHFVLMFNQWE